MERRKARSSETPGYPAADEVLENRREFISTFGKLVLGAAVVGSCGPPIRLGGKVMPPGEIRPPEPTPPLPGEPPPVGCLPDDPDCPPLDGEPPMPDPPLPGGVRPPPDPIEVPLGGEAPIVEPPPEHPPLSGDEAAPEEL